jgi:hypothetical protein
MTEVRDKKKAYIQAVAGEDYYIVRNWKNQPMGRIEFNDDWSLWVFLPDKDTFYGPAFLQSLAGQMDEIQADEEAGWE